MSLFGPPNIKLLKRQKNIRGLNRALHNKDPMIVREAGFALAELHHYSLIGLLLGISDSNWEIRRKAFLLYAGFVHYGFIPLIVSLFDPEEMVRFAGLYAILERNEKRAVDSIGNCILHDPSPNVRLGSIIVIGKLNKNRAVDFFLKAKNDPDTEVRNSINEQLVKWGFPSKSSENSQLDRDTNTQYFSEYSMWKELSLVISKFIDENQSKYVSYSSPIINSCIEWMALAGNALKINNTKTAYKYLWNIARVTDDIANTQTIKPDSGIDEKSMIPFYEYNQASNILINTILLENEKVSLKDIKDHF